MTSFDTGKLVTATALAAVPTTALTGTLQAAQEPAHSGDVTNSAGSLALTIANAAVTLAKMANMATASLIYRKTAGSGAPEVNTLAQLKTDLALTGADLAGGMGALLIPASADDIACCIGGAAASGTLAGVADRCDIYQYFCPRAVTVSGMKASISTGVGGANVKLVLYDTDSNGRPTTLLGETSSISAASAVVVGGAFGGGNVALTAKTYFVGIRHSSTASIDTWDNRAVPRLNAGTASTAARCLFRRAGVTFASGAPNPWVYSAAEINTGSGASLWLTVA